MKVAVYDTLSSARSADGEQFKLPPIITNLIQSTIQYQYSTVYEQHTLAHMDNSRQNIWRYVVAYCVQCTADTL